MSASNDGGPAFPMLTKLTSQGSADYDARVSGGMLLRAYFAGQMLPEAMRSLAPQECAEVCVDYAGALIAMLAAKEARK